jgi:lipoate-protein ligase A
MAADEVLLEHVAATGRPALRLYTWDPPTLSLGYFQPVAGRLADPRLAALPVVRRPTGGGAIVHHHELTYGLALPTGPLQRGVHWACRMHDVIRAALGSYAVPAAACAGGQETGRGAFLCFQHQTPGDVLLAAHKVVGSAQRRRAGALLQHGSILLAASPHAPHLSGVRELLGVVIPPDRLADDLVRTFAQMTGWEAGPADWTAGRLARRAELVATRYAHPAWTERR